MKRILSIILTAALLFGASAPINVHAEAEEWLTKEELMEKGWNDDYTITIDNVTYKIEGIRNTYEILSGVEHDGRQICVNDDSGASGVVTILGAIDGIPVTTISQDAFNGNNDITEVIISEGVLIIGDFAFYYCPNLKKVSLPDGLKVISSDVFDPWPGNESLQELTIPASVEYLAYDAFWGLDGTTLIFEGNAPELFMDTGVPKLTSKPLYVRSDITIYICEGTTGWDTEAWETVDLNVVGSASWPILNRLLQEAELLVESDYTAGWDALQEAIAAAEVPEHADTDTVNQAIAVLEEALAGLIVDRTELDRLLEDAELLVESDYAAGWDALQEAIAAAQELSEHATAEAVHGAEAALENAMEHLVPDTTELLYLFDVYDLLRDSDYTDKSYNSLRLGISHISNAIKSINTSANSGSPISETAQDVHYWEQVIREDMDSLVLAEGVEKPTINLYSLENILGEASELEEAQYTSASWAALQEAVAAAEEILDTEEVLYIEEAAYEDTTISEIIHVMYALSEAMENLVTYRAELDRLLEDAALLTETDYTPESWEVLQEAVSAAQGLAEDADTEAVYNAVTNMEKALEGLVADRTELDRLLEETELLTESDYTPESWKVLQEAVSAAEALTEAASVEDVHKAAAAIEEAVKNLAADRTELDRLLGETGLLTESDYTPESWEVLQEAVSAAEGLAENPSVDAVHGAIAAIEKAMESLVADRTQLDRLLEETGLFVESDYTPESWEALQEAIATAKALTETASVEDIHGAIASIEEAVENLVLAEGVDTPSVNKEGLKAALEDAADLAEAYYTSESWTALQKAVTAAKKVFEATDATPADVIDAAAYLREAINALVLVTPVWDIFTDVTEGQWYADAIQHVYYKGIMEGNGDKFTPNGKMTRGMFVTTLYRLAGEPEITDRSACEELNDVAINAWYTDAVCWAYSTKVTTGYESDKTFRTNIALTREQLATFIYRYAQYQGMDVTQADDLSGLLNADKVKEYAQDAVKWAVSAGLISGLESTDANGTVIYDLAPQGTATRAQMAAILMRFMETYGGNHE